MATKKTLLIPKEKKASKPQTLRTQQIKRQVQKDIANGVAPKVYDIIKKSPDHWEEPAKGNKFTVCKTCGETFEQDYIGETNRYQSYETCLDCRHKVRWQKEKALAEKQDVVYGATLKYSPYEWQKQAGEDFENVRFQVLACGNRCFVEDSFLTGCNKEIKDVKVGDKVLGSNGKLNRISYANSSQYSGDIYTVKALGCLPFSVTVNHQVCVVNVQKNSDKKELNNKVLSEEFIAVENLKVYESVKHGTHTEHYLKIPRAKGYIVADNSEIENIDKKNFNQINEIDNDVLYNSDINVLIKLLKTAYPYWCPFERPKKTITSMQTNKTVALQLQIALARLGYLGKISEVHIFSELRKEMTDTIIKYVVSVSDVKAIKLLGYDCTYKRPKDEYFVDSNYIYVPITSIKVEHRDCLVYDVTSKDGTVTCSNALLRQSGKDRYTTMRGIMYFIELLNENRHLDRPDLVPSVYWWIIAPVEKMAMQNFKELIQFFPKEWIVGISKENLTIQTVGGGVIEVRSAFDPESLVGVGLDFVTITEAARIKHMDIVWANLEARLSSPGRGRLKDRGGASYGAGKAIINSSPIGKNYFYTMWCWGQKTHSEYSSNWISYQLPWFCNPSNKELGETIIKTKYGEVTYEQDLRRRLGERMYKQNYLADFLASDGTVFKKFEDNCVINLFSSEFNYTEQERKRKIDEWQEVRPYHQYRIGWDIASGSSGDSPVINIKDKGNGNIVRTISLYGKDYEEQYNIISYWSKTYNNAECAFSKTGNDACVGQLAKRGVFEIVLDERGGGKLKYIRATELAVQAADIHMLFDGSEDVQTFLFQMNDYTEENGKFSNKEQPNDDFVSALCCCYFDYEMVNFQIPYIGFMECLDYSKF